MSWTDERIDTLKKLWSEGKSASEIADFLGNVTRNAVIGKAHRLGLSGRPSPIKKVKPQSAKEPKKAKKEKTTVPKEEKQQPVKPVSDIKSRFSLFKTKKADKKESKAEEPAPVMLVPLREEPKIDPDKLVGLLDLTEKMCRWPVGDPKEDDFGFCGQPVHENHLYCPQHVVMAYQISTKKSDEKAKIEKRRKMELAAKAAMEDDVEEEEDDIDLDEEINIDELENVDDMDEDEDDIAGDDL